jgi:hypothetical protein
VIVFYLTLPKKLKNNFMNRFLTLISLLGIILLAACNKQEKQTEIQEKQTTENGVPNIDQAEIEEALSLLVKQHGEEIRDRANRSILQIASLWNSKDGCKKEFVEFCLKNFIANEEERYLAFVKISDNYESLRGCFNKMSVDLKKNLHLDLGPIHFVDEIFGSYDPSAHLESDFYDNKTAFIIMLNFPNYSLKEKNTLSENWTRKDWAYARLGDLFTSRIPAEMLQNLSKVTTEADSYISGYNIYMGYLVNDKMDTLFSKDKKLISHWNLRDEIKSCYGIEKGLELQRVIYDVMKRIIAQDIPKTVINSDEFQWNPATNKVYVNNKEIDFPKEENVRYQHMLNIFHALKAMDEFSPLLPTYIARKFEGEMEMTQEEVEKIFIELVSSPQVKEVANLISKRLGRPLEPFDIWYDGFKSRSSINENHLNSITSKKFPNPEGFSRELPIILKKLGWESSRAELIASRISVDPARGAGHAWGAEMKGDVAHLRTRIDASGMNYKGYNIAIHEFGHNVEQTITLYDMDFYTMHGVPNTAFTEAIAFMFQNRDLELLGMKDNDKNKKHLYAIDNFWGCYEIMGVSLVDMEVWKWLYKNPQATANELRDAVISISKDIWNKYFAEIFGVKDQTILAIYSHMIDAPLYLSAYPIGHLIDFQLENYITGKTFSVEIEKVLKQGRLTPQAWMKNGIGEELSINPLLEATSTAVVEIGKL